MTSLGPQGTSSSHMVGGDASVPILLVDDNPTKRLALRSILRPLGYSIVEAESGLAALRCLMVQDFAVILLDVRMQSMDGFETAALIRQRPRSEMTPIIFITSYKSDEIVHLDRYAQGAVDFMFAPVQPDELRAKVSVFANIFRQANLLAERAGEVQLSADRLRLLTDAAPIGIFQTDGSNRYVYTNPRWSEITGVTSEHAWGRSWETIIGAEQRASVEVQEGALAPGELEGRFEIQVPGGASRIVLVTSKPISDRGDGDAGWVGTLADVTDVVRAEAAMSAARDEANEASRLKSDFLANMSHEIRTPMNGVIGMTDLLLETDLDARQRDYAQTVRNSGEALLTIINDILDFAKVESGTVDLEDTAFSVRAVVEGVVNLLAGSAQDKGLELVAVLDRSVPSAVSGDPGRVRQVLTNLVGNAIKFTQAGEIVVRVTASGTGEDTVIHFEVSDPGDGIAPDKLASVFEPFVQADTSTSRRYGGTGLGLAITGQLVALMGGECGVTSELGVGSTFRFTIAVRADGAEPSDAPVDPDLEGVAVLIADDSPTQRAVLADCLTDWGMLVASVGSGQSALAELQTAQAEGRPFEVALLDRTMPGMDDLETVHAVIADATLTVRMVLLTSLRTEPADVDNQGSAIFASLSKPIDAEMLRDCLRVALRLPDAPSFSATLESGAPESAGDTEVGWLLLAEDNPINQKVAVAMLSSAGYRVDTVPNGRAAVAAAGERSYDAILMDCQMPEMNGYEATAAIRALEGTTHHTPIIALTAGARPEDRERCLIEGMDSYVAKPVNKDTLLGIVARAIGQNPHREDPFGTTAHTLEDEAVMDQAAFDELQQLGNVVENNFLVDLVDEFVEDTASLLVQLRTAHEDGDTLAVMEIAHNIKGSCSQLGGRRLAEACAQLIRHPAAQPEQALREIEENFQELRYTLRRQLSLDGQDTHRYANV